MDKSLIPLSSIAEYVYCPRSTYWLLVDSPRVRDENIYIQDGRAAHEKVDVGYVRPRGVKRQESSVRVYSELFGISGVVDVVEFYSDNRIVPVEFKRGSARESEMHRIQIALAAICLKEMFPNAGILSGAIFFTGDRRRVEFSLDEALFERARMIALFVSERAGSELKPSDFPQRKDGRCKGCCFRPLCFS